MTSRVRRGRAPRATRPPARLRRRGARGELPCRSAAPSVAASTWASSAPAACARPVAPMVAAAPFRLCAARPVAPRRRRCAGRPPARAGAAPPSLGRRAAPPPCRDPPRPQAPQRRARRGRHGRRACLEPAREGRMQRGGVERLHHVVVHAGGQAGLPVIAEGVCGECHDGRRGVAPCGADRARGREPVHDRHQHIHQDQVMGLAGRAFGGRGAVARDLRGEAEVVQPRARHLLRREPVGQRANQQAGRAMHERQAGQPPARVPARPCPASASRPARGRSPRRPPPPRPSPAATPPLRACVRRYPRRTARRRAPHPRAG